MALEEESKLVGFILWGIWMSVQNFYGNLSIVVEIFQSRPKWWTNRPIPRLATLVLLKTHSFQTLVHLRWEDLRLNYSAYSMNVAKQGGQYRLDLSHRILLNKWLLGLLLNTKTLCAFDICRKLVSRGLGPSRWRFWPHLFPFKGREWQGGLQSASGYYG